MDDRARPMVLKCAGPCGKQMGDPPAQEAWYAIFGRTGDLYLVCPECEPTVGPTLMGNSQP
ncbi:hypothetical protein ACTXG7_07745 [Mycolicibacterium sp. Dal123E01]|uniref:hypothetical protein n=1 Tax=Mycolicibacterium sp. Dal123E01 TaxID=3457578 RepID=UPI00403E8675